MKTISLLRMSPLLAESPFSPAPGPTTGHSYLTQSLSGFLGVLRTWHPIILTSQIMIATFKGGLRFGANLLLVGSLASGETLVTTAADENNGSLNPSLGTGTSLREAVLHSPTGSTTTFSPALAGCPPSTGPRPGCHHVVSL